jgi:putative ABC transport system permease protein
MPWNERCGRPLAPVRGRLRHVLLEGVLLAVVGTLVALPIGLWTSAAITRMILPISTIPLSLNRSADLRVLVFAAALAMVGTILFGWLPAFRSLRTDPQGALRAHTRTFSASGRLLRVVVVAQLTLSVILLTNAGLLTRSLQQILTVDLGFDPDGIVTAIFTPRPGVKQRPTTPPIFPR